MFRPCCFTPAHTAKVSDALLTAGKRFVLRGNLKGDLLAE